MSPEKNQKRRQLIKDLLSDTSIAFQFISANDEYLHNEIDSFYDSKKAIDSFGRNFTFGEIISTLNHLTAYQKFLQSDDDFALILEDDSTFKVQNINQISGSLLDMINKNKPEVYLLTPVISYLNKKTVNLDNIYKIATVIQALDSSGYIINRLAAQKMLEINEKIWIIADNWILYKKHVNINFFCIIPSIVKQNPMFSSNLANDRKKQTRKEKTIKYVLSRYKDKIIADFIKYCYLIPFRGYTKN